MENEILEFDVVDMDNAVVASERTGMGTGVAMLIGAGIAFAVGAGVKFVQKRIAAAKAKKELKLAEKEIPVDDADIRKVTK